METSCRVMVKIAVNTKLYSNLLLMDILHVYKSINRIFLPQQVEELFCIYRAQKLGETVHISVLIYVNNTL